MGNLEHGQGHTNRKRRPVVNVAVSGSIYENFIIDFGSDNKLVYDLKSTSIYGQLGWSLKVFLSLLENFIFYIFLFDDGRSFCFLYVW